MMSIQQRHGFFHELNGRKVPVELKYHYSRWHTVLPVPLEFQFQILKIASA